MFNCSHVLRRYVAGFFIYLHTLSLVLPVLASDRHYRTGNAPAGWMSPAPLETMTNRHTARKSMDKQVTVPDQDPVVYQAGKRFKKISGPSQPEMTSFSSVNTDNMVNLFTGDFSYSIPLGDVGGYPLNLFYSAGITMDQEASWTGLGWNLNPGTISRNMRGIPDDFDGTISNGADQIHKEQYVKPNITVGLSMGKGTEVLGSVAGIGGSMSAGISYNNYTGLGLDMAYGLSYTFKSLGHKTADEKTDTAYRLATASLNLSLGSKTRLGISPSLSANLFRKNKTVNWGAVSTSASYSSSKGIESFGLDYQRTFQIAKANDVLKNGYQEKINPGFSMNFARQAYTPGIRMPLTYLSFPLSVKLGKEKIGILFQHATISGYYQKSYIQEKNQVVNKPAYGYLQLQNANGKNDALLDFNRLNDVEYVEQTSPAISIPQYTYDVFSISGEGTGGSFRAYRPDIGYVRDAFTKSSSTNASLGLDFGVESDAKLGASFSGVLTPTSVGEWSDKNLAKSSLQFRTATGAVQPAYFKNPGEKTITSEDYYHAIGDDQLARLELIDYNKPSPSASPQLITYADGDNLRPTATALPLEAAINARLNKRDKRSQVISYLNAEEAGRVGLETIIKSYRAFDKSKPATCAGAFDFFKRTYETQNEMQGNYRQPNHISQIDVVEQDGKRYVYGLPVYNVKQRNVTFAVDQTQGNPATQEATYEDRQASLRFANKKGKDHFYTAEEIPPYAHSFLLTGLLSADYTDVTGDGITDDDQGTAVKFNYSRSGYDNASKVWNNYKWRSPSNLRTATYNEGLKTDNSDDKGSYSYGEKELWYLHSVESKTMVAYFITSRREDARPVLNEDGGIDASTAALRLQRLDRIEIYAKADIIKYGTSTNPVKSIHFEYDYSLCVGEPTSGAGLGKLTLTKVWFQYNGSTKAAKNSYKFNYNKGTGTAYHYSAVNHDRWGNFKDANDNPAYTVTNGTGTSTVRMSNTDFPYATQPAASKTTDAGTYATQKEKIDAAAAAWNLRQITLPSGSSIDVTYEADDYAYVQNRRAAQMTRIEGFSLNKPVTVEDISDRLYENAAPYRDYEYACFRVAEPVSSVEEAYNKYLAGITQLLMKLNVKVPKDQYSGTSDHYEPMVVYAKFGKIRNTDYGYLNNPGSLSGNIIWIRMTKVDNVTPVVATIFQFLKNQLRSKVFPGSDVKGELAPIALIKAQIGALMSIGNLIGENNVFKVSRYGQVIHPAKSFGRLNNPLGIKMGGGHRVKKIVIQDNWEAMTSRVKNGSVEKETSATYGQEYDYTTTSVNDGFSSTISSGVASYEPFFGAEENPFREILNYSQNHLLGPTEYGAIELPLAEAFYPTAMVGYSRVRVRSIHNKLNKNVKAGTGVQETEFYTTKDFPTLADFNLFDNKSRSHYAPTLINKFLKFWQVRHNTLSQGFRVQLNDMNGKMKAQSTYPEDHPDQPLQWTRYHYKTIQTSSQSMKLDNRVDVIKDASGVISPDVTVGKDIELMIDFREHNTKAYGTNLQVNLDIKFPWWFVPSVFVPVSYSENIFRSVSVLKLITSYGNIDKVEVFTKGSKVNTTNLVYDAETGNPLLTATENLFGKATYSFNYPAHWAYDGMGGAYKNIDVTFRDVYIRGGFIESGSVDQSLLQSGDEIYVVDEAPYGQGVVPNSACTAGCPPRLPKSLSHRVWALDISKSDNETQRRILLLERDGTPYNGAKVKMRVIRSGRRNLLNASVGAFTSLANPVVNGSIYTGGGAADPKILNASAVNFKEKWRGEDAFFLETTYGKVTKYAPVHTLSTRATQVGYYAERENGINLGDESYSQLNGHYIEARRYYKNGISRELQSKSWALFDLGTLNSQCNMLSVHLNLYAHTHANTVVNGYIHTTASPIDNREGRFGKYHTASNPHQISWSNWESNRYTIHRLRSGFWPVSQNQFKTFFEDAAGSYVDPYNGTIFSGTVNTPYLPPNSTVSYCSTCGPNGSDNRIGLANSLITNMIKDRDNPAKGYVTAIQFSNTNRNEEDFERRMCFFSGKESGKENKGPALDIRYYLASEAQTTPPAGPDYTTFQEDASTTQCKSVFSRMHINPYVHGLLGNWRSNKAYTYYGDRQQDDLSVPANLATDGTIKSFLPYWTLSATGLSATTNETKWKWNSEITQVNKKGMEIESRDPLGRYNAGLYGYNESLPVAVANNAHAYETAFEGFEDYGFNDVFCPLTCQPKRHWQLSASNVTMPLDATQSHSGKYSLRVAPGSSGTFTASGIVKQNNHVYTPGLTVNIPRQTLTTVNLSGQGLQASYYKSLGAAPVATRPNVYPNILIPRNGLPAGWPSEMGGQVNSVYVNWDGYLVVDRTGSYTFSAVNTDDEVLINIKDYPNTNTTLLTLNCQFNPCSQAVNLTAGVPYKMEISFRNGGVPGYFQLLWKVPCSLKDEPIPMQHLYGPNQLSTALAGVTTSTVLCSPTGISATNPFIDRFELPSDKEMVFSAWVKEGTAATTSVAGYQNNAVTISFADNLAAPVGSPVTMTPTGNIIDGWQRYEAVFRTPAVPANTEYQFEIAFKNNSGTNVFFDDVRIHPFHANLKSFVYDPATLRLTAEMDENNFASFYEYDDEGTLTRVKKETREGIKTVQETRSSLIQKQ